MAHTYMIAGLIYGDEGKGSYVDHIVRKFDIGYVLRANGGAQALHHVVTPEGVTHGFSQFGSGTFFKNTKTILSHYMLIEPLSLIKEAEVLESKGIQNPFERLIISENAPMITIFHIFLNRLKETIRGDLRHGSCGFGIGETQSDIDNNLGITIYMKDLDDPILLREKLQILYDIKLTDATKADAGKNLDILEEFDSFDIDTYFEILLDLRDKLYLVSDEEIIRIISKYDTVFEGAQGVLLDQSYGFFPYCTRSNTTFENGYKLLASTQNTVTKIGLLRAYGTRHGAGPFVTETNDLYVEPCHNSYGEWQQQFRTGWFDCVAAKYALEVVGGVDILAVTNLDRLYGQSYLKLATSYQANTKWFPAGNISMTSTDLQVLSQRSQDLMDLQAEYIAFEGFTSFLDINCQYYLDAISHFINHEIHGISERPDHIKYYFNSQF